MQNYSGDFHKIRQKGGANMGHGKKLLDFGGNPDNVMSRVRVMNPWGTEYRARIPKPIRNNLAGA